MKILCMAVGILFIIIAALSVPTGFGYGLYSWVFNGLEFKLALWKGFTLWLSMFACIAIGYPLFVYSTIAKKRQK